MTNNVMSARARLCCAVIIIAAGLLAWRQASGADSPATLPAAAKLRPIDDIRSDHLRDVIVALNVVNAMEKGATSATPAQVEAMEVLAIYRPPDELNVREPLASVIDVTDPAFSKVIRVKLGTALRPGVTKETPAAYALSRMGIGALDYVISDALKLPQLTDEQVKLRADICVTVFCGSYRAALAYVQSEVVWAPAYRSTNETDRQWQRNVDRLIAHLQKEAARSGYPTSVPAETSKTVR